MIIINRNINVVIFVMIEFFFFQDLLDDFFKDENIEGVRCDICNSKEKYKKCVFVFFLDLVILFFQ